MPHPRPGSRRVARKAASSARRAAAIASGRWPHSIRRRSLHPRSSRPVGCSPIDCSTSGARVWARSLRLSFAPPKPRAADWTIKRRAELVSDHRRPMRGNDDQTDRRDARANRLRQPVTTPVLGRTTTWLLALWSGYIATWATVSGSGPWIVAAWWLAGVALLQMITHYYVRPRATPAESSQTSDPAQVGARLAPGGGAVQDWESEGGAIA